MPGRPPCPRSWISDHASLLVVLWVVGHAGRKAVRGLGSRKALLERG